MIHFIQRLTEKMLFITVCIYVCGVDLNKLFSSDISQILLLRILLIIMIVFNIFDLILFLYYSYKKNEYIKHPITLFLNNIMSRSKKKE